MEPLNIRLNTLTQGAMFMTTSGSGGSLESRQISFPYRHTYIPFLLLAVMATGSFLILRQKFSQLVLLHELEHTLSHEMELRGRARDLRRSVQDLTKVKRVIIENRIMEIESQLSEFRTRVGTLSREIPYLRLQVGSAQSSLSVDNYNWEKIDEEWAAIRSEVRRGVWRYQVTGVLSLIFFLGLLGFAWMFILRPTFRKLRAAFDGLSQEITACHAQERAVSEERDRARLYLDVAGVMIIALDHSLRVKLINRKGCDILGYHESEVLGSNWCDQFVPENVQREVRKRLGLVLRGESSAIIMENPVRTKEGVERMIVWHHSFVKGSPNYILSSGEDITDKKKVEDERTLAENKLRALTRTLAESNEDLKQFAHVASHDLQEPLRAISLHLGLLNRQSGKSIPSEVREYLEFATDGALRLSRLIQDLLSYSMLDLSNSEWKPVDLTEVVRSVIKTFDVLSRKEPVRFEIGPLPSVFGSEIQLTQLFQNLFSNSIKFKGEETPVISVTMESKGKMSLFRVSDNGIGIAPSYHKRIFLIFQRLHNRKTYSGSGIGLAICRKVVRRHGGRIWVESEEGKGSTFCFTLSTLSRNNIIASRATLADPVVEVRASANPFPVSL